MNDNVDPKGTVDLIMEWKDGRIERRQMHNRILRSGRILMAQALANQFGAAFEFFVVGISFGSGGTTGGAPRYIDDTRTGLFGPTITTKAVISSIDPTTPTKATFTSVLTFDEAVGSTINEMALKLASGDYYSMVCFADLNKSSSIQLTFNWSINFV